MPQSPFQPPSDPLAFIRECVKSRRILWTFHVNMRLDARGIDRTTIIENPECYEIIEQYPNDKYLPSYLVLTWAEGRPVHVVFATDVEDRNVRIVTAYQPDTSDWSSDFRSRKP